MKRKTIRGRFRESVVLEEDGVLPFEIRVGGFQSDGKQTTVVLTLVGARRLHAALGKMLRGKR